MTSVRVRFAPSPTGTIHLGSARSALYNWLYARHHGADGTYVLRVEDTDQERSNSDHVAQALRVFRWLGFEWDEGPEVGGDYGPYFQSQRGELYADALTKLRDSGAVYPCFCTKEELAAERDAAGERKQAWVYSGRCRSVDAAAAAERIAAGDAHVFRFRVPDEGSTTVHDIVHGDATFEHVLLGDFVIARADGSPLYNFANVVDDAHMRITHVIRGSDHLSNTPRQILIYGALGADVPEFAHLPMVLGPDGAKLSKRRHHTSSVEQLAEAGYAPAAVRNGLALVGWSLDDVTNVMTTEELIAGFDITRIKRSPAAIDYDKLSWLNGEHLRAMTPADWAAGYDAWRSDWLAADSADHAAAHIVDGATAAMLVQEKVATWSDAPPMLAFLLEPFVMEEKAWLKLAKTSDQGVSVLDHVIGVLEALPNFDVVTLENALRGACETLELKAGKVFAPIRFAATGRPITPGLWESLHVLGRERTLERLRSGRDRLAATLTEA